LRELREAEERVVSRRPKPAKLVLRTFLALLAGWLPVEKVKKVVNRIRDMRPSFTPLENRNVTREIARLLKVPYGDMMRVYNSWYNAWSRLFGDEVFVLRGLDEEERSEEIFIEEVYNFAYNLRRTKVARLLEEAAPQG